MRWLLPPLVVVAVVAAGGAYMFLDRRLTAAYDHNLGDIARALLPYIRSSDGRLYIDFTPQAEAVLRADSIDHIYYALLDSDSRPVAGDRAMPVVDRAPRRMRAFWDADPPGRAGAGGGARLSRRWQARARHGGGDDAKAHARLAGRRALGDRSIGAAPDRCGRGHRARRRTRPASARCDARVDAGALARGPAALRRAPGGRRAQAARGGAQRVARAPGRRAAAAGAIHRERRAPAAHADRGASSRSSTSRRARRAIAIRTSSRRAKGRRGSRASRSRSFRSRPPIRCRIRARPRSAAISPRS